MFKISKPSPNRIEMELEGSHIDEATMENAIEQLLALSAEIEHGEMLYRLPEFPWPSLAALGVKFEHLPGLFKMLGRFDRCALLTDAAWMRTVAEVEGALIPGLEIKGFAMDEFEVAEKWLAATDE